MFEISLAHKSHILHACHEKANYMRVGHVALNSAESDSSKYYLIQPKTEHGYTLATNGRGAGVCLANTGIGETEQPSEYANPVGTITRVLMFRCHCMAAVVTWIGRG